MYSVVIASLPDEPKVVDALESIFDQTLLPEEVMIIIDSEVEVSATWAAQIERDFPHTFIHRQTSTGMASAVSSGIRRSKGSYVAFLDADDLWSPTKQEVQIGVLRANSELDAVTCSATNLRMGADGSEHSSKAVSSATFTATTFRRDCFDTFGFPDVEAGHFVWLYRWWWNARQQGIRTEHVAELGLIRRIHGNNSWFVSNDRAHHELRLELHRLVRQGKKVTRDVDSELDRVECVDG